MDVNLKPGKYVVAVSGGVDSVVLLNVLSKLPSVEIIVAHFDHGIRVDSEIDRMFVADLTKKYQLPFTYLREELGPSASEELARNRRYLFLYDAKKQYGADAIVTAHHKNDVLETAVMNLLRGTGRKGLTSLISSNEILRPLLGVSKSSIIQYAKENQLSWREDPTNQEFKYTRNKVRAFLKHLNSEHTKQIEDMIQPNLSRNIEIDDLLEEIFTYGYDDTSSSFSRVFFNSLPYIVEKEVVAYWLRAIRVEFDKKTIRRLTAVLKTAHPGSKLDIDKKHQFNLSAKQISIEER